MNVNYHIINDDLTNCIFLRLDGSKFLVLLQNYPMNLPILMEMEPYKYKEDIESELSSFAANITVKVMKFFKQTSIKYILENNTH